MALHPAPLSPASRHQPQCIIVVPLSAGTKVIRILLMSVPSLCPVFVVQGPVSCRSPVTACPSYDGVWPPGRLAADKWSSKVSSPPSPFNGVQTIEKLNQLSPGPNPSTVSCLHSLAWFIPSAFSLIPVSAALLVLRLWLINHKSVD